MLKQMLSMNVKGLQIAFLAGSAVGCGMGCIAGLGIGVAVGVLLAPKSGTELRSDMKGKARTMLELAKEKTAQLKERASEAYTVLSEQVEKSTAA